jgi:hypothetical protein
MNYNDKIEKVINDAVSKQKEKLYRKWCNESDAEKREQLYAEQNSLIGLSREIIKLLRESE